MQKSQIPTTNIYILTFTVICVASSVLSIWLVGGLEHVFFDFPIILGMSSSQLTKSIIFLRGVGWNHQPVESVDIDDFQSSMGWSPL